MTSFVSVRFVIGVGRMVSMEVGSGSVLERRCLRKVEEDADGRRRRRRRRNERSIMDTKRSKEERG